MSSRFGRIVVLCSGAVGLVGAVGCHANGPEAGATAKAPLPKRDARAALAVQRDSFRTKTGCQAPDHLAVMTVEPGSLLVWNANGTALAIGKFSGRSFWPLDSGQRADQWGSVTLLRPAARHSAQAPFRGSVSALPNSESFLVSGDENHVVDADGRVVAGLPVTPLAPVPTYVDVPSGGKLLRLVRTVLARAADAGVGIDLESAPEALVAWRRNKPLERFSVDRVATNASYAISDDGERVAVSVGAQITIYELERRSAPRVVTMPAEARALAFRPASSELAVATTGGVELLVASGATVHLADRVEEPEQWSAALSPSGQTLAIHLGQQLISLSLVDGAPFAPIALEQPSTGRYAGIALLDDSNLALLPEHASSTVRSWSLTDPRQTPRSSELTSPNQLRRASFTAFDLTISGSAPSSAPLSVPLRQPDDSGPGTLLLAAWGRDSRTLITATDLNLPRSTNIRISQLDADTGTPLWSQVVGTAPRVVPTEHGLIVSAELVARIENGKQVFSTPPGALTYSPTRDLLAVALGKVVQLVDRNGTVASVPLSFGEPVQTLSFDTTGMRLALGTATGLHVVDLARQREVTSANLDAATECLGWHRDLVITRCISDFAPERAFCFVDATSGATLKLGFLLGQGPTPAPLAIASNGWVDASSEVLAALRGGEHHDQDVPAACTKPGLLRDWLRSAD